jgi:L-amino acid N-acyltransferase
MDLIKCDRKYAAQILDIFNEAILNTTSIYDYKPRPLDSMKSWFDTKEANNFPVIGLINEKDELLGFGTYGTFRARPAYKYTVEHSVYVHKNHRGKGCSKILLKEIIKTAEQQEYHCLMAGIDSSNEISIKLHKNFGFEFCGRVKEAGYKFNRWLDLDFYQLLLKTPANPVDG